MGSGDGGGEGGQPCLSLGATSGVLCCPGRCARPRHRFRQVCPVLGNKFYVEAPRSPFFSAFLLDWEGFAIRAATNHNFASNLLPKTQGVGVRGGGCRHAGTAAGTACLRIRGCCRSAALERLGFWSCCTFTGGEKYFSPTKHLLRQSRQASQPSETYNNPGFLSTPQQRAGPGAAALADAGPRWARRRKGGRGGAPGGVP